MAAAPVQLVWTRQLSSLTHTLSYQCRRSLLQRSAGPSRGQPYCPMPAAICFLAHPSVSLQLPNLWLQLLTAIACVPCALTMQLLSPDNMNRRQRFSQRKDSIIHEYQRAPGDTGSSEVQSEHLNTILIMSVGRGPSSARVILCMLLCLRIARGQCRAATGFDLPRAHAVEAERGMFLTAARSCLADRADTRHD